MPVQAAAPLQAQTVLPFTRMQASPVRQRVPLQRQRSVGSQKPPEPACRQRALLPLQPQLFAGGPQTSPPPPVLCALHALPQPPQLESSALTFVSHPLSAAGAAGVVQLPKPTAQLELQTPPEQARDSTFALLHPRPQPPQWLTLFVRLASQPFCALPSQFPKF